MRFTSVIHILGFLLMFLAVAMLLPIPFAIYYGGERVESNVWMVRRGLEP